MEERWYESLNLRKTCSKYRVGLWQCPQFLFILMGFIIVIAIIATYAIAILYQDPYAASLTVIFMTAVLFLIGYTIVRSFEKIALASLSKSEFISIMSHQLRSPLSAIKWQLNVILSDNVPGDGVSESLRGYLEAVDEQNERMIREVNDLLDVNRIEDNDLVLRPTEWSLGDLTKKVMDDYNKYITASNLKTSLFVESDLPNVFADEERIKRVAEHFLDNAIRYSQKGGNLEIRIEAQGDEVYWQIKDEGPGISEDDKKRIFDKFFRSNHALRYQTEGSGVGLFISKSIIKMSGGKVGFSSAPDQGSTFWFALPARVDLQVNKKL